MVLRLNINRKKPQVNRKFNICVIPGDGIGLEVMPEAINILRVVEKKYNLKFSFDTKDWSCKRFNEKGAMMPDDGLEKIQGSDAILLGACGFPGVPDHVSLWGLLIPIRRKFRQYLNLRPVRMFEGLKGPLKNRTYDDIDFFVVRENNEGEYSEIGGLLYKDTPEEMVIQQSVFTRKGTDRVMHAAFNLAKSRKRKHVTSATKSNGILYSMPYWDARFKEIAMEYPEVSTDQFHIDILSAHFVLHPDWFDVVVASNLFGDILSDLGPAITGTIGIAPSGNINPERDYPSCFEPVHGSAPDIAGRGIANPIGQIWSAAMMLEHLGCLDAAAGIVSAIEKTLRTSHCKTPDMGGNSTTRELGKIIAANL